MRVASQTSKGHGRVERRTITTTTWLNEYLSDWPGVAQVFRLERRRKVAGREEAEVVLFEPATTQNTGNVRNERTRERLGRV